jgi:hypothetical protein
MAVPAPLTAGADADLHPQPEMVETGEPIKMVEGRMVIT